MPVSFKRPILRQMPPVTRAAQPLAVRPIERRFVAAPMETPSGLSIEDMATGYRVDPYVDYGRFLTPQGCILIVFKDIDQRLRHVVWKLFAWTVATGFEAWFLLYHSPVHALWINIACLIAIMLINGLIVAGDVELYRTIEIRPDCLVIDGADLFWAQFMEGDFPSFRADEQGNMVLCGIYGTRAVDYLTIRRFDEFDRTPEVFAAHLRDAVARVWSLPF